MRQLIIVILTLISPILVAQDQTDTLDNDRVNILHADDAFFEQSTKGLVQRLIGNVAFYQDSTFFYCDSAIIIDQQLWAQGNIQILQGDSTSIFADSLYYSGEEQQADLFGEVSLINKENELFTDHLTYDVNERRAQYEGGARLRKESTQIESRRGYYILDSDEAIFRDSVVIVDKDFLLLADSLLFNTKDQKATFQGPTSITQDSNFIYCESGYYDFLKREALFADNAAFVKGDRKGSADRMYYFDSTSTFIMKGKAKIIENGSEARADEIIYQEELQTATLIGNAFFKDEKREVSADKIYYNQKSDALDTEGGATISEGDQSISADRVTYDDSLGVGLATGNVIWKDTTNDLSIHSDRLDYNNSTGYIKATGRRPWIEIYMDDDTLFVSGDTLLSTEQVGEDADTSRSIFVYNDVKIFKRDLQGVCDSLVYHQKDSMFRMYEKPLLWADTSQFSGDTIDIFLKDKTIDQVHQVNKSLIASSPDLVYFNQVQGKKIVTQFLNGKPDVTLVTGNAQALYFALDEEDAYIGANKSICSSIKIKFEQNQIRDIYFHAEPKAEMLPMSTPGLKDIRLEGFFWQVDGRPLSKRDVILGYDYKD